MDLENEKLKSTDNLDKLAVESKDVALIEKDHKTIENRKDVSSSVSARELMVDEIKVNDSDIEAINKIANENGLNLSKTVEAKKKAIDYLKNKAEILVVGLATATFASGAVEGNLAMAGVNLNTKDGQKTEENMENEKKVVITKTRWWESGEKVKEMKMDEWKKAVWTDKNECVAISIRNKKGKVVFFEKEEEAISGTFKNLINEESKEDMGKMIGEQGYTLERIHSHPLEAMASVNLVSKDMIEKMRNGQIETLPMPPSMVDIISVLDTADEIKRVYKNNITTADNIIGNIKDKVVDPTGVWEFSIDESSQYIKDLKENKEQYNKSVSGNDFDEEKANQFANEYEGGFPFEIEILSKAIEKLGKEKVDNSQMVNDFISAYKERGINLIYTPHKKENE